jgi:hypothetical protein
LLTGFRNVSYTISPANGCGGAITKSFGLNIQPKKAGPLLDNNNSEIITDANGAVVKSLIPNTSSQINLRFQNSINGASYLWRVPVGFNTNGTYSNGFVQTSSGQYAGNMPSNALIDYSGEVTVIGYCGTQIYPFTIKARQAVTVPENLESCGCVVDISINNPNYDNVYSAWEQTGKGGTVSVINNETVRFTAPTDGNGGCKADKYTVGMSIAGVNGNKITNITIGGNTAKWLSGTLSDVRKNVSSNLVYTADQRIFFSARDGKLYYYEFDKSVNKWVPIQYSPSITTAKNVAGNFVNIAARSTNGYTEVFYTNATDNFVWKSVNGNNSQQIQGTQNATSIHMDKRSANPYRNTLLCRISDGSLVTIAPNAISATSTGITNVDNSALLGHGGNIYFVRNQELYRATYTNGASQTKISGTFKLHPKTSFDFDGDGRLYVCEASGKMLRINLSTLLIETVVTTAGFCDGEFAINPTANNALNIAIVYAKHKVGGQANYTMWKAFPGFIGGLPYIAEPATSSTFDYVAHSPIYVYPHVYYVAETTPEGVNSAWNLYFKENCTPAIFRKGDTEVATSNTISTGIKIYPNPMGNMLHVEANGAERAELWNTLGTKVSSFNLENGQANLNTEQLSSGVYILNLFAGDGLVATQKLVK